MKKFILYLLLFVSFESIAQGGVHAKSHDAGIFVGGSYYIGDLNPRKHFLLTQPAIGIFYRYNYNYRLAFRAGFNYGKIQGDDSRSDEADQLERNLNFTSDIYELYATTEFNFWEYQTGNHNYTFAPYVFLGLSGFNFTPYSSVKSSIALSSSKNQNEVDGQRIDTTKKLLGIFKRTGKYPLYQIAVPFGIGFKLSFSNNVGFGFEWGPRKTFTDYLDDVSNRYLTASGTGQYRGNPTTKDWYFYYGVTFNFKINLHAGQCAGNHK